MVWIRRCNSGQYTPGTVFCLNKRETFWRHKKMSIVSYKRTIPLKKKTKFILGTEQEAWRKKVFSAFR